MKTGWKSTSSLAALLLAVACGAGDPVGGPEPGRSLAGWYIEHAEGRVFQPCGASRPWRVTEPADLPARARSFGLERDTPVYVRIVGAARDGALAVERVEQFGSPTPVRDCALTGVVIPEP